MQILFRWHGVNAFNSLAQTLDAGFFDDSIANALIQKRRWKRNPNFWDIQTFFVALINIDDAIVGLKRFLDFNDSEFWKILKSYRREVERFKLGDLRNDLLHRNKIFKQQDKKGNPLPKSSILILGGYNFSSDEYIFGVNKIKVSEAFQFLQRFIEEIRKLFKERLCEYYKSNKYGAIIPWTSIRSLSEIGKLRKSIASKLMRHKVGE